MALTSGGSRLKSFLDGLPIETEWIAGHHVVWQTGQQDGPAGEGFENHTHCSAFVAAVALYLDIYVLRPPHHTQELLANSQMDWFAGNSFPGPTASQSGWRTLGKAGAPGGVEEAVTAANTGKLVIAGYRQPPVDGHQRSGHIVLVRPQDPPSTPAATLVTMAGHRNWREIRVENAFASHPGAWPDKIGFFVRDTDLEPDTAERAAPG
jgi:hypothetical protein